MVTVNYTSAEPLTRDPFVALLEIAEQRLNAVTG